jgi:hypothetical protein
MRDHQRDQDIVTSVPLGAAPCLYIEGAGTRCRTVQELRGTHNAGVAGSSPAPAISQPVGPHRVSGLPSFPPVNRATTSATKRRSFVRIRTACAVCHRGFIADRLDLAYCSPRCGMFARGRDEQGHFLARGC